MVCIEKKTAEILDYWKKRRHIYPVLVPRKHMTKLHLYYFNKKYQFKLYYVLDNIQCRSR